ncbi:hypothetical protein EYZ11_013556 [Aspergillus tanneri]|uniref:Uncharacterized protein n=1 Tax=Aspergillus tanneri TaxID=1220188 RepID=A0A4S3IZJ0_9EURO|nr:uncharacterized protein ATNIH1004_002333 [Aspergillus tanneri]KAA8649662.1 hypothetical protein ATNIH1004_002333 [Aspergillus tanneri]THC86997.1 hypothetical protein EYZ11_013556 [Aspergillus tanneri]
MEHGNVSVGTGRLAFQVNSAHLMEHLGYMCIRDGEPREEDVTEVERVYNENPKHHKESFQYCKGGVECERFLNSGNQIRNIIEGLLNKRFPDIKKQGPAIVEFAGTREHGKFMRAHPSREAVSVFRPLRDPACWDNGLFKLYTSSHHQTEVQFQNTDNRDAHEIVVGTDEVLVIFGGLHVQLSPNSGIRMVWQGFSKRPMLSDIWSPLALPFMKV